MNLKHLFGKVNTYIESRDDYIRISKILDDYSDIMINNESPSSCNNVAFVVGGINRFGGGSTSILRMGTYLAERGINVSYITYSQSVNAAEKNAKYALSACKGAFIDFPRAMEICFDIVIATFWTTVYKAIKLRGYKMYFIQDYEPLFYGMSEEYLLAKKSYEMGFHLVSLGKWNLEMIKRSCAIVESKQDSISFPYEPSEYEYIQHDFTHILKDKQINIAIYIRSVGKRIPYMLQWILGNLQRELFNGGVQSCA